MVPQSKKMLPLVVGYFNYLRLDAIAVELIMIIGYTLHYWYVSLIIIN